MTTIYGVPLIPGNVEGEVLASSHPLSFWGGVDPSTGLVIDQRHELCGESTVGKILVFPGSKGSSTGSEVLLEAVLNKTAPAGMLVTRQELILTLGAIIAEYLYQASLPIIKITDEELTQLLKAARVRIYADGKIEVLENRKNLSLIQEQSINL
jgi:predicted aconitase with swiveling domain